MLYTVRGAAAYLGISRSALRNRIVAGTFPKPDDQVDRGNTEADVWSRETLAAYLDRNNAAKAGK